jgi:ketosteroid isomerase-like protein
MKGLSIKENVDSEAQVREAVNAFYTAFDEGFVGECDFATEDWNHINPNGGWTRGREQVLREVKEVHTTFLIGVRDTVEDMSVRYAACDAAVVTVTSQMSTFFTPDGIKHENERHIRTFVVVNRGAKWLVMQDQNTVVGR